MCLLFCFVLFWILCCVWKKKKKIVDNKKKKINLYHILICVLKMNEGLTGLDDMRVSN